MIFLFFGGQFGSEGKGSVISWFMKQSPQIDLAIRTGSPNAGHTFMKGSAVFKMRQLPCTWAFSNADIFIPASAVVNVEVLKEEIFIARKGGYTGTVFVHPNAAYVTARAFQTEREAGISTGTTGEGVGGVRALKALRQATLISEFPSQGWTVGEPDALYDHHTNILIEGTQGYGLSLDVSYPFCTSTNIDPYHLLGDAGVPYDTHLVDVWCVLRTFPIRIAGNSGALRNETSWEELQKTLGSHIPVERTTVTQKVRRVGAFDMRQAKEMLRRCNPDFIVLTFFDYLFPEVKTEGLSTKAKIWLDNFERELGNPVSFLGVGVSEVIER